VTIVNRKTIFILSLFIFTITVALPVEKGSSGLMGLLIQNVSTIRNLDMFYFDESKRIELLVETTDPYSLRKWLQSKGGSSGAFAGGIMTVRVPVGEVNNLLNHSGVLRVRPSRKLKPLLDVSRSKIHADTAEAGIGLPRGVTGSDVIVGIVDTGIDYNHPDFKNPDGSTRIIALWDQTLPGNPPQDFGYGRECSVDEINSNACPEMDADPDFSHGTHVMGISAGGNNTYRGIAPKAMIVAVKTTYTEGSVVDGVDYIFRIAEKYKKPAVVNLSLGGNFGPHDGTGELVRMLEQLQGPGKTIIAAGGNSGNSNIHAGGSINGESWYVFDFDANSSSGGVDIWYPGGDTMDFAIAVLKQTGQFCSTSGFVPPGQSKQFTLSCGSLNCGTAYIDTTELNYSGNGDRNVVILLQSPSQTQDLSRCRWVLGVKPNIQDPDGGNFDSWIMTDNAEFTDNSIVLPPELGLLSKAGDAQMTISVPADGKNIIAVGSFVSKTAWRAKDGNEYTCEPDCVLDNISNFSSKGPTRDGRVKPDITAPGEWIVSTKSGGVSEIPSYLIIPDGVHFILAGTSMASPHVTGAVALMYDLNPQLTPEEIKNLIINNADIDVFTGGVPNNQWGYGKLNVSKILQKIVPVPEDATPPEFLNVVIKMEENAVNVSWDTNELASSTLKVSYHDDQELVFSRMSYSTHHNFNITGVETKKIFKITVESTDPRGNTYKISNLPGILPGEGCGCNATHTPHGGSLIILIALCGYLILRRSRKIKYPRKPAGEPSE